MAKFTPEDIKRLADLAMLDLTPEEIKKMVSELENIFSMIEKIQTFDTKDVEPTDQVTGLMHVTRADEVVDYGVGFKELISGAAKLSDDSIKVPSVK